MNYDEAYNAVKTHFAAQWAANAPAIVGSLPAVRYDFDEEAAIPVATFARFKMDPVASRQSGFRDGENGQRYTNVGLLFVQLLVKRRDPGNDPGAILRQLADQTVLIFAGRRVADCVTFDNVRINKLAPEPAWLRANIIAEYRHDDVR